MKSIAAGLAAFMSISALVILPFASACGIYTRGPLFPGGIGSGLPEGTYRGNGICTRYFQTRGRAPTLNTFDMEFVRQINADGVVLVNGQTMTAGAEIEAAFGVFIVEESVKTTGNTAAGYVVSFEANVDILDDAGDPLRLSGSGSEVYNTQGESLHLANSISLETEDAEQEIVQMAFDCSADLAPE